MKCTGTMIWNGVCVKILKRDNITMVIAEYLNVVMTNIGEKTTSKSVANAYNGALTTQVQTTNVKSTYALQVQHSRSGEDSEAVIALSYNMYTTVKDMRGMKDLELAIFQVFYI